MIQVFETQYTMCNMTCMYIYIYRERESRPGVDRISDIFKKDFQKTKIVGICSRPCVFTRFSSLLKSFLGHFGNISGEILKNGKVKKTTIMIDRIFLELQKIDRILFQNQVDGIF